MKRISTHDLGVNVSVIRNELYKAVKCWLTTLLSVSLIVEWYQYVVGPCLGSRNTSDGLGIDLNVRSLSATIVRYDNIPPPHQYKIVTNVCSTMNETKMKIIKTT